MARLSLTRWLAGRLLSGTDLDAFFTAAAAAMNSISQSQFAPNLRFPRSMVQEPDSVDIMTFQNDERTHYNTLKTSTPVSFQFDESTYVQRVPADGEIIDQDTWELGTGTSRANSLAAIYVYDSDLNPATAPVLVSSLPYAVEEGEYIRVEFTAGYSRLQTHLTMLWRSRR